VLPAAPGFYHRPGRVDDLVDFVVQWILDHIDIDVELGPRWSGKAEAHRRPAARGGGNRR
jgi:4-hydroxy-3-polyprenylbenzoate decarboxylase